MTTNINGTRMKVGLALGSGSARGWAHIGVINALAEQGIEPDIICGCSAGSLIAASYATEMLPQLEEWALSLTKKGTARFIKLNSSLSGVVNTNRLHSFLNDFVATDEQAIEKLTIPFGTVSTELETGREIWFTRGPLLEAVWASISMPGLFPAIRNENRWLVDGGLVNPVPVTLCRALGAEIVIAVNLNSDIAGKQFAPKAETADDQQSVVGRLRETVREYSSTLFTGGKGDDAPPGLLAAIASSLHILQDRITRNRIAGDPPDILLTPRLMHIGLLEYFRAEEVITEGQQCVERQLDEIRYTIGLD
jgi:NTE family protein